MVGSAVSCVWALWRNGAISTWHVDNDIADVYYNSILLMLVEPIGIITASVIFIGLDIKLDRVRLTANFDLCASVCPFSIYYLRRYG